MPQDNKAAANTAAPVTPESIPHPDAPSLGVVKHETRGDRKYEVTGTVNGSKLETVVSVENRHDVVQALTQKASA
jgi:hypothetical protein